MGCPVVYVAHPVRHPSMAANLARAKRWLAWLMGETPGVAYIAPWITACELVGEVAAEHEAHELGLLRAEAIVAKCDALVLVGGRVSAGMARERDAALRGRRRGDRHDGARRGASSRGRVLVREFTGSGRLFGLRPLTAAVQKDNDPPAPPRARRGGRR
jgi:hypothetical protein